MPLEFFQIPLNADLPVVIIELNRALDAIARRLNYIREDGNETSLFDQKLTDVDDGTEDADGVRLDQILLVSANVVASRLLQTNSDVHASSVLDLTNFILGATDNGDGTVTLPTSKVHLGTFFRDTSAGAGIQTVNGVGFTPVIVITLATVPATAQTSIGFGYTTGNYCLLNYHNVAANTWNVVTTMIYLLQGAGVYYNGSINAFTSDGFKVSWASNGAKAGLATMYYLALGN